MEVHFAPETEEKLRELAAQSGLDTPDELVREVVEGYFDEVSELGAMLSSRYEDLRSGRVRVIAGGKFRLISERRAMERVRRSRRCERVRLPPRRYMPRTLTYKFVKGLLPTSADQQVLAAAHERTRQRIEDHVLMVLGSAAQQQ